MNHDSFKNQVTYILLFSKFAVIATIFFHLLQHKFVFEQVNELLFIILPLFTIYLTIALKTIFPIEKREQFVISGRLVKGPIVFIGRWIPIMFAIYMIIVLSFQSSGTALSSKPFNQMKEIIGWGESIFGIYLGYIFLAIFQKPSSPIHTDQELLAILDKMQSTLHNTNLKIFSKTVDSLKIKDELRDLIAKGKIIEAVEKLRLELQSNNISNSLLKQVILLSAQYQKYLEDKRLNLNDNEKVVSKVALGLLDIIEEL